MTPIAIAKRLLAAGFGVPPQHPLGTGNGITNDPRQQADDWIDFTHNGKRWAFDSDQLAQWDEVEGHFEFLMFHQLTGPTVESVGRFIDQI